MASYYDAPEKAAATFMGYLGVAFSITFSNLGSALGISKAGIGISSMGVLKPEKIVRALISVIMAGILGIYGLVVCVLLVGKIKTDGNYTYYSGFAHLASGMINGLSGAVSLFNIYKNN